MRRMGRLRHRLSAVRIRTRLLGLVLLPLVGATIFAASTAASRSRAAGEAQAVSDSAERVGKLTLLVATLNSELDSTSGMAQASAFGVDPWAAATESGFDLVDALDASRGRVDEAFAALGEPEEWLDEALVGSVIARYSDLQALRESLDNATIAAADTAILRGTIAVDATAAARAELEGLAVRQTSLPNGLLLARSVDSARNSLELIGAARTELEALTEYLLPLVAGTGAGELWTNLVVSAALYDRAADELTASLPADMSLSWDLALSSQAFSAYEQVRSDTLSGALPGWAEGGNLPELIEIGAQTFSAAFARMDAMGAFDQQVGELIVTESRRLEDQATAGFRKALFGAIALAVGTLGSVAITARSIARPLDRLERRARRISAGDFEEAGPEEAGGPVDVVAVGRVLDELTRNLMTIDSQAAALAEGDLTAAVLDEAPTGSLGASIQESVVRVRNMTAVLDHQAHHDSLTGLANRAAVIDELGRSIGQGSSEQFVALWMFDLDGFKHANDTLGHLVGDELLRHSGARLARSSENALVARLGGDEFVIVAAGSQAHSDPEQFAERALLALGEPFQTSAGQVWLTASVGIATTAAGDGVSSLELLRRADLALYEAKAAGPGSFARFDQQLSARVSEQTKIEAGLREAIDADSLALHYQPIVDLVTGKVAGFESLVRWRQADGTMLSPEVFVPIAERTDLIIRLDDWVINRACEMLASLNAGATGEGVGLSVNISGRHLGTSRIVGVVEDALHMHGARPQDLLLEMTETGLIPNFVYAVEALAALREMGVRVAIDDFGTGFASVAHLRKSHFDRVKIDRGFIANLSQPQERSIAQLLISLGRDLGLEVVAEGLETEEQVRWAREMGCTHGQGFYLGRPAPTIPTTARLTPDRGSAHID